MKVNQETILYLNVLLNLDFQMELMEELENLPKFRHNLKNKANQFKKALIRVTEDDLELIWGIETQNKNMYRHMDEQSHVIKKLAYSRPELCTVLKAFIAEYEKAPQAWNERFG